MTYLVLFMCFMTGIITGNQWLLYRRIRTLEEHCDWLADRVGAWMRQDLELLRVTAEKVGVHVRPRLELLAPDEEENDHGA